MTYLPEVGDFLQVLRFPQPIKPDRLDISGILLKVALNTITPIPPFRILDNVCDKRTPGKTIILISRCQ